MGAWYSSDREAFVNANAGSVVSALHERAARDGWLLEPEQDVEWRESVTLLQAALADPVCSHVDGVLLEYDFRRRGIRMDCILIARNLLYVIEFKRSTLSSADRDQVVNYCVNLLEFHELTQRAEMKAVPVLVSRTADGDFTQKTDWHPAWPRLLRSPICARGHDLARAVGALRSHLDAACRSPALDEWDGAGFFPSSTIIDAALSLYGNHDVSAIRAHRAAKEDIDACLVSVLQQIEFATAAGGRQIVVVSGVPGAGKTLVGLSVVFRPELGRDAVFVTGNAPLVDVLNGALNRSYVGARRLGGYRREGSRLLQRNVDFKIVKAHQFLSESGNAQPERIAIFDEAQRTYAAGTTVMRRTLERDEADLILEKMESKSQPLLILLVGQNQHINRGELGPDAWLKAAEARGWRVAISDETLALPDFERARAKWSSHRLRARINGTHLVHSVRSQKTVGDLERWVHLVMSDQSGAAHALSMKLPVDARVRITRSLERAREWARTVRTAEDRAGLIASGQARRLRPEGIFCDEKPDIVDWMLAPTGDVRSSNMLEQTQNQYQIQGLEIDYAIVCWDADLRRHENRWACFNVVGGGWRAAENELTPRRNSYRVLLTRARKGTTIFVPYGDRAGNDPTRTTHSYQEIVDYLFSCGASEL